MRHCTMCYTPLSKDRLAEVRTATLADESLVALKNVILTGFPDSRSEMPFCIRAYYDYRDELTVQNGIVQRGERIIIPASMRKDIKQRVYAGHLGINSCIRRAREIIFWPGMSSEIRQYVEACPTCATYSDKQAPEPMVMREVPDTPYETVATDIFTLRGKDYLITVDGSLK